MSKELTEQAKELEARINGYVTTIEDSQLKLEELRQAVKDVSSKLAKAQEVVDLLEDNLVELQAKIEVLMEKIASGD